ncbi:MAG: hypothetical protein PHO34_04890 [Candidatus Omnitrophica bacterium]|nr:hypothetical protein [Candidatus Omnitrophota bacterium]MDD5501298.1 hypothetical protein [Candidatus Omnitrophota bacterium]
MRTKVFVLLTALMIFVAGTLEADEVSWEAICGEKEINTVLAFSGGMVLFAGCGSGDIMKSSDGGESWQRAVSLRGGSRMINDLEIDIEYPDVLYAATDDGLYRLSSLGKHRERIFSGREGMEKKCISVSASRGRIFSGTARGLFVSNDKGKSWGKINTGSGEDPVLDIVTNGEEVFFVSPGGVFRSVDRGCSWSRVFVRSRSGNREEETLGEGGDDEDICAFGACSVRIDPNIPGCAYFSCSEGIYKSMDHGDSWTGVTGHGLLDGVVKALEVSADSRLFALTGTGIFVFEAGHWSEFSVGLPSGKLNCIYAAKDNGYIYAASKDRLFCGKPAKKYGGSVLLEGYLEEEPDIRDVQKAAIKYAEVSQEKISSWRDLAAKKALLPKLAVGIDSNSTDLWHWESGSSSRPEDDCLRRGRGSIDWDISLTWDLGDLIWNEAQTSIDVRSRLMVELREDILDQVNKLYFERLRAKSELDGLSIDERKKRFDKQLRIEELTASLDSLTCGYYSEQLKIMASRDR